MSLLVLAFNSCSNEIDVLGDYEENAAVYAILDPLQPIQFVKINKVFTNPGASSASVAQLPDSLFFDSIAPTLTEVETGRVIELFKANVLLKDNGYFASSPNYLYATKEKIYATNPNNTKQYYHYRFDLYLPKTNKHISATTNIPDSLVLNYPETILSNLDPLINISLVDNLVLKFKSPVNGKIIDAYFYFNYMEINRLDTNIKTTKTIKWHILNNLRTFTDKGGEFRTEHIGGKSFYDLLLLQIPADTTVNRKFLPCRVEFSTGNLELDNYIQISAPSIGIVQKQSDYSNLSNGGIGIFAGRRVSRYNGLRVVQSHFIVTQPPYQALRFVD